ncbi:hypothetical protein HK407_03g04930 [Ordospora pajunii]|uniref:uncharacterized protein n=1 Tax=Ordospora pajunii TaxID=3039483 RepID=UPI0029526020|nr:uncharacterized protein HK407_03g04930 [Ordospora pajunii]KAH9411744.1 hypothetical protein HK407_03g04930 [Ordospora pajunii]
MSRCVTVPLKIMSDALKCFVHASGSVMYGTSVVQCVEIVGVCVEEGRGYAKILDFCGEVYVSVAETPIVPGVCYSLICKPYIKKGEIRLHCRSARRVCVFEEMFFWAEASSLSKSIYY